MACVIENNLEKSVNEFQFLKKTSLFKKNEIAEIIRYRRRFEYALQKRTKRLHDYDAFISAELCLLKLIRIRRQKLAEFRFKNEIEKSIIFRLVYLHRQICFRFASRVDVWLRYVRFCERLGRRFSADRVWRAALRVHARTSFGALWIAAAASKMGITCTKSAKASPKETREESEQDSSNDDEGDRENMNSDCENSGDDKEDDERERSEDDKELEDFDVEMMSDVEVPNEGSDNLTNAALGSGHVSPGEDKTKVEMLLTGCRQIPHSSGRGPVGIATNIIVNSQRNFALLRSTKQILDTRMDSEQSHFTNSLIRAQVKVGREAKLAWDRAWLTCIREARQLLTRGVALNCPAIENNDESINNFRSVESAPLLIQLARLELCAADFFLTRILPRKKIVDDYNAKESSDAASTQPLNKEKENTNLAVSGTTLEVKRFVGVAKKEEQKETDCEFQAVDKETLNQYAVVDSQMMLADISEDVEAVADGVLFRTVVQRLLTDWPEDTHAINVGLSQMMRAKTLAGRSLTAELLGDKMFSEVQNRIQLAKNYKPVNQKPVLGISTPAQDVIAIEMMNRLYKCHEIFRQSGRLGILKLWSAWGWYDIPSAIQQNELWNSIFVDESKSDKTSLQCFDPKKYPTLLALLRARLQCDGLEIDKLRKASRANNNDGDNCSANEEFDTNGFIINANKATDIIQESRTLLNRVAASSRWAGSGADFWLLYMWFESTISHDVSWLPSVRWRAQNALESNGNHAELKRFNQLVCSGSEQHLAAVQDGCSSVEIVNAPNHYAAF